ncbi:MAG: hypothetical protein ACK4K9_00865 [Bacteroidia bacterium]
MKLKRIYILQILVLYNYMLFAQRDTVLSGSIVDVVKDFKPILSESIKIPINPNPEIPEITKTNFIYEIPNISFSVEPTIYTIKPLTMGTMLLPKLKGNYLKVGFGNYTTPFLETYINTVRNKNRQAGFYFNHLSSAGDNDFNNFSNNKIKGYIKEFAEKNIYSLDVGYNRIRVNQFGFQNDLQPSKDSLKNIYNQININGGYELLRKDSSEKTRFGLSYNYFGSNRNINENNILFTSLITRKASGVPVSLPISVQHNAISINANDYQRTFININPEASLTENEFYIKAGFNSTIYSDSISPRLYFFPKAEAAFHVVPQKLTVLAGITGNIRPHTFRCIATENPFATNIQFRNEINKFEIYGGIKGQLSKRSSFNIFSSTSNIENMLFYANDTLTGVQRTVYDDRTGSLVKLGFEADYQVSTKFMIAFSGTLYNYKLNNLSHPFSRPGFEYKLNMLYNMGDKFVLRTDIFYMNQRFGAIRVADNDYVFTMNPFTDANIALDYRYNKNVSAFIQCNNIANNRYQIWLNHPVYGFNLLAGLTFTF